MQTGDVVLISGPYRWDMRREKYNDKGNPAISMFDQYMGIVTKATFFPLMHEVYIPMLDQTVYLFDHEVTKMVPANAD